VTFGFTIKSRMRSFWIISDKRDRFFCQSSKELCSNEYSKAALE